MPPRPTWTSAIAAARNAFDTTDWSRDHALRARCLRQLRDACSPTPTNCASSPSPKWDVRCSHPRPAAEGPITDLGYFADPRRKLRLDPRSGEAKPMGIKNHRELRSEAVGVAGAITPWNFLHQINPPRLAPALAAGCTVVLKPAPRHPVVRGAS